MDLDRLDHELDQRRVPAFRQRQVRAALFGAHAGAWDEVTTLPKALRAELAEELPFSTVTVDHEERSGDGSVKLRLTTADGWPLEAVLMRFDQPHATGDQRTSRFTACLSSQSGCALACTFCATGKMGLGRNLTRFEIVDQFAELLRRRGEVAGDEDAARIDNVVMMGMGEPFHNYDEVLAAIRILNGEAPEQGFGLAARRIAISTVGWVPGIEKLAAEPIQVKLALSLHAPNDEVRSEIMPIVQKRYPIARLMQACAEYRAATNRRIFVEYLMLQDVNDRDEHARELAALLRGGGFHVNLIAYNPTGTDYVGSSDARVQRFASILEQRGVGASYRVSRARDISGACGQLAAPIAKLRRERSAARSARAEGLPAV